MGIFKPQLTPTLASLLPLTVTFADSSAGVVGSSMAAEKEEASTVPRRRLSCTTCFNSLWFCYSPVHQMQMYDRLGEFDNCSGKWSALTDCLILKTKRSSEVQEILEIREKQKPHIWNFRTPEEASAHWQKLFGHLDGGD